MVYKAECTVEVKDGESLQQASLREVMEAVKSIKEANPNLSLSIGYWEFTDGISLDEYKKDKIVSNCVD